QKPAVDQSRKSGARMSSRGNDAPAHFAKADTIALALAPASNRKGVAILKPFAGFTVRKLERIRPTPGQFQHATTRVFSRPADGAAREQVAWLKIAAVDNMVCELLCDAPV